jgi:hypothetical protein
MRCAIFFVFFLATSIAQGASPTWNWNGPYSPCRKNYDLLSRDHMDLGVRIATSNAVLAGQFERAMNFWSEILDMTWHEVTSEECAVQLVDGAPELFASNGGCACATARSQLPDRRGFQGWIAFNPAVSSTAEQMFRDAVHEMGHLFGLQHNPSISSVMFFDDFGQESWLDLADLRALAGIHKLRPAFLESAGRKHAGQGREVVTSQKTQPGLQ